MMPLTWKAATLRMEWCLDCHRDPEPHIRPKSEVFNMAWTPPENQLELGRELAKEYGIYKPRLTNCSICHY
jgi:hypothetical protein